jgi:UDPglucose 6-dehydrogenase
MYEAAQDADALLILTDWTEFAEIDLANLRRVLRFPIVIDGRNLYSPQRMAEHGFTYSSMGRPSRTTGKLDRDPSRRDDAGLQRAHSPGGYQVRQERSELSVYDSG